MPRRPRLLVTGFGAFPGAPENPTATLVDEERMAKVARLKGVDLIAQVLPVEYALLDVWRDALDIVRPDAILHFGLAASAQTIRIETKAHNNAAPYRSDAAGGLPGRMLDPEGRPIHRVNLPVDDLMQAVQATGLFVRRSVDAGDYLCNAILYASLQWCAQHPGAQAGFIHVPRQDADALRPAYEAIVAAMISRLSRRVPSSG
ncbi:MAG: pyroglutamyl-peptidase I [Rhodobiaceae bacterium]|nr:pyroglutamyl-peptidase I [Rhodobiaceae bacterium]